MNEIQEPETTCAIPAPDDLDATQAVSVPAAERTSLSANVECPVCRTQNPPSERYCVDCGFLLEEQPDLAVPSAEQPPAGLLVTPDGVREFLLKQGENTVGREKTDVLLTHSSVSRRHAVIRVEDSKALLEDVGSTNGTFVNGARIEPGTPAVIEDGSELLFGSETLIYKAPQASPDEDAASAPSPRQAESETVGQELSEDAGEVQQPVKQAVARLVSADGAMSFDIFAGVTRIGRRQGENDVVVPDPYVSGRHADLQAGDGVFTIMDVESSNGTTVNGVGIEPGNPVELKPGDEIGIGRTALRLEVS